MFTLLGGGHSFSAGGPGKGLYSRIYRDVLIAYPFVDAALSTAAVYDDTGVFSIYGACPPLHGAAMVEVIANQFFKLASEPALDSDVARARNQLKSQVRVEHHSRNNFSSYINIFHCVRPDPHELGISQPCM